MEAVNPKKSGTYKEKALDKYWDAINEIPDPDIKLELKGGKKVTILEDSENNIDIPDYPSDD